MKLPFVSDMGLKSSFNWKLNSTIIKQSTIARYNKHVRPREFQGVDLVLRRADVGGKNARGGKLVAN